MRTGLGFAYEGGYYGEEFYGVGDGYSGGYGGYDPFGYEFGIDEIPYAEYEPEPLNDPYVNLPTFDQDYWYVDPGYSPTEPYTDYWNFTHPDDITFQIGSESCAERWSPGCDAPQPPITGDWWDVPYQTPFLPPMETPPYVPYEPPAPAPPPLPQSPATQQPNLPPACPTGSYHPYPIGHPRQNECAPFPTQQQRPQQQPRPQASPSPSGGASQPRPQQQQQQPSCPTYCKHPQTGQWFRTPSGYTCAPVTQVCTPISGQQQANCPTGQVRNPSTGQCVPVPQCATPGTVFDARAGRCVPFAQAQQPLCPPGYWPNFNTKRCEPIPQCQTGLVFDQTKGLCVTPSELDGDILEELKKLPWWVWAALGGFFLLSRSDEGGKKTTVTYRRASA